MPSETVFRRHFSALMQMPDYRVKPDNDGTDISDGLNEFCKGLIPFLTGRNSKGRLKNIFRRPEAFILSLYQRIIPREEVSKKFLNTASSGAVSAIFNTSALASSKPKPWR